MTGWETTERVLESGGFESRQRVVVDDPVVEESASGARTLGVTYWRAVDRFTRGVVRATWTGEGGRLKLLGGATLLTFGPDARKNPAAADVVKRFADKKIDPEGFTLYGYAATQVIAAGIKGAGSADPQAVADKLHGGLEVDTVIGPLSYNDKGDITRLDFVFYELKGGKFVEKGAK